MNKKTLLILYSLILIIFFQTIQASQYSPNMFHLPPLINQAFSSNAIFSFSAGFANEAYNNNGKLVPFLEQYGPENFLERFVNPELGQENIQSAGQGLISGQYHFKQYYFNYTKYIYHKLFFGALILMQDDKITNITPKFLPSEYPLSDSQITYLEELEQILPKTVSQSGMYTLNMYIGYSEKLTHFNHIDSFKAMILLDLSTPQVMSDNNLSIFQFPVSANYFFGYPIIAAIEANINSLFSLGISSVVIPFQELSKTIPFNDIATNNHLLFTNSTQAKIQQEPYFAGTLYANFKNNTSKYKGTVAYSHSQYLNSHITPINPPGPSHRLSHQSVLIDGFTIGSLLLQLDINCVSPEKDLAPIVSFFVSIPMMGKLYKRTYLFGGSCNFNISYEF